MHSQVNLKNHDLVKSFNNADNKSRDKARRDHNQSMKVIGNQFQKIKEKNYEEDF